MSQPRKTYGRRVMPNTNMKSFMLELKDTSEDRKRKFPVHETGPSASVSGHRPLFQITKQTTEHITAAKRLRISDEDCSKETLLSSKALPSPPTESTSEFDSSPPLASHDQHGKSFGGRRQRPPSSIKDGGGANERAECRRGGCHAQSKPSLTTQKTLKSKRSSCQEQIPRITNHLPYEAQALDKNMIKPHESAALPCFTLLNSSANGASVESLSEEILEIVLAYALTISWTSVIRPRYRRGMLNYGMRSETMQDEGIVKRRNIDLSSIRVCKSFHRIGSRVFYGESCFGFDCPLHCEWWLKRIGPQNFSLVNRLTLRIGTDWIESRALGHSPLASAKVVRVAHEDMCCEERWAMIFSKYIQPHHQLESLCICFDGWRETQPRDRWSAQHVMTVERDRNALDYWRGFLLDFLEKYMRVPEVDLDSVNDAGRGLTKRQQMGLMMVMSMGRDTAHPRKGLPKLTSLGSALEQVVANRQDLRLMRRDIERRRLNTLYSFDP